MEQSQKHISIHDQQQYGLLEARLVPGSTSADPYIKLMKDDGSILLYAARATCLDITYAVGAVSKFNTQTHLIAVKRYLKLND